MTRRLVAAVAAVLLLTACSGGDSVPDDQPIKPAEAPSGWESAEVGPVTLAVDPSWEEQPPTSQDGVESTAWRAPENEDGLSSGGVEVRLVAEPQQAVDKAAESLAISAMAGLGAGKVEPLEVVWPNAEGAYLLEYEAQVTGRPATAENPTPEPFDEPVTFTTRTLVLALADGSQVQVTALSTSGAEAADQAIASVVVPETTEDS